MKPNRREFLVLPGAAAATSLLGAGAPGVPWHQKIRRVGQVNMTERDPVELNVEEWANYWASLKVDAVLVSVTGILAFYQTKVPFHRKGKFLGDRDFFGDCCAAAKKRGIHVIARMSPDLNWEDAVKAHPEWFRRDSEGKVIHHGEDPRLFATCMYSTYFTDYVTAIMREVNSLYDIDGIFTNAWPPLGRPPVCYCDQCRKLGRPGTPEYWDQFNQRCLYLWKLYDAIAKEKKPDNLFFANLGGSIRATPNLKTLGEICHWFNCDNQGRGGDDTPIWGCTMQGRVCQAAMKGKTSTNVTAAWSTGSPRWRNVAKSPAEARMWMDETVASGMVPWYHFIGGQNGLGEDRRWHEPGRQFFNWLGKHERHFVNKRSIANLGVVMGQRTHLFYRAPAGVSVSDNMNGLYYALLEGRFLFDFVHEDDLGPENLKKYSALLLPNTALLSDEQCGQLRAYVEAGGITGTNGNAYYARIMRPHPILDGFAGTNWIPGAEFRLPVTPVENPVLTVVPGYVAYPPELSYPPIPRTEEPAVVVREKGRSRLVYFPGDVERTSWRSGHTDLSRLLQNSIRWLAGQDAPVTVAGDGVIEPFAWETGAGFALHVLNYTNPAMHKGSIRRFYPIGPQKVRMKLPAARKVSRVELLRAEKDLPFRHANATIEFTIPSVADYEVAALYSE